MNGFISELPKGEQRGSWKYRGRVPFVLGIVGAEEAKFTKQGAASAKAHILRVIRGYRATLVVSGGCHLGGIDIWATEIASNLGIASLEYLPKAQSWQYYKARNIQIARKCNVLVNYVVSRLPNEYTGMRFPLCYHCNSTMHVKSGGCWTMNYAHSLGKRVHRILVEQGDPE